MYSAEIKKMKRMLEIRKGRRNKANHDHAAALSIVLRLDEEQGVQVCEFCLTTALYSS